MFKEKSVPCPRSRLRIWSREAGSAVPCRVIHLKAESGAYSRDSPRFPRRCLFTTPIAIESAPSLSGHAMAYRWCSLPRLRRHRASSHQGSSSNGCCLFRCIIMDQFLCASLFPHTLIGTEVDMRNLYPPHTQHKNIRSPTCTGKRPNRDPYSTRGVSAAAAATAASSFLLTSSTRR